MITIEELLGLKPLEIQYIPYGEGIEYEGLYITHGDVISKHSGWTAKAHYERYGGCGMVGHSHRLGSYFKTERIDTYGWWENGCLCDLQPEYVNYPNWCQGFSIGYFTNDRFFIEQVPIIDHKFMVEGKYYN